MATAKVMIILLMFTVILTTSTVLISTAVRPSDTADVVANLLRMATAVSWIVLAIFWVGNRIIEKIDAVRAEALTEISTLASRWGDHLMAAELEARLSGAERGSSSSIEWINRKRST